MTDNEKIYTRYIFKEPVVVMTIIIQYEYIN